MSKHITQKNDISTYLEFSNLQIASEHLLENHNQKILERLFLEKMLQETT